MLKNGDAAKFDSMSDTLFAWTKKWIENKKHDTCPKVVPSMQDKNLFQKVDSYSFQYRLDTLLPF